MLKYIRSQIDVQDIISLPPFVLLLVSLFYPHTSNFFVVLLAGGLAFGIGAAVHHAEMLAHRLGPALGTLLLALSVTIIEVALILSLISKEAGEVSFIARDTVFATVMIVTNGIMGSSLFLAGVRKKELGFQVTGTTALFGVLAVLSTAVFVLPNFTTSSPGPIYSTNQLIFVSAVSLVLYISLVFAQNRALTSHFEFGSNQVAPQSHDAATPEPSFTRTALSASLLILSLIAVVGLSKMLSPSIEKSLSHLGAPKSVVGIVVAILVLAPEALASVRAATANQLQTSLNLALGSGAASIALTIPVVSVYCIAAERSLALGIDSKSTVLLFLTFIVSSLSFSSGKTTALHGIVHLVIMATYVGLSLMP